MKRVFSSIPLLILSISLFCQNFGNAISFDGLDDYGMVHHSPTLDPGTSSFSMTCWFQAPEKDQRSNIVLKRIPEYPWTQYSFGFGEGDPHVAEDGKKIMINYIQAAEAKERSGYSTFDIVDGEWHHLAVIANRDVNAIILYLDGIQIDFHPVYFLGNWPNVSCPQDLMIATSGSGVRLEAKVDELILWNKAVNAKLIHTLMEGPVPQAYYNTNDSGVVAYYRFEEMENLGVGQVGTNDIRDIGPFGNHMDTDGGPYLVPSVPNASVSEQLSLKDIEVFPNPSDGRFSVRIPGIGGDYMEISIYDRSGQKLANLFRGQNIGEYKFDLDHLSSGMYFIKVVKGSNTVVQKLLIQ